MIARKKSWLDNESDDHANFSCGESEATLQQYTADQEMYAIRKNKLKNNNNNENVNNNFKHPSPIGKEIRHQLWNSCSVSFLTLFSIFFPKNFRRWCLYCIYIIILDTKLFNVFAIFNLVSWQTSWRIALNDVKRILPVLFQMQNIESPPSAAYMKKKNAFLRIQSPLLYLETAHLLEKNTRNVF